MTFHKALLVDILAPLYIRIKMMYDPCSRQCGRITCYIFMKE